MAGRIRTIKPELLEDERTASLSHPAWRLFVSLVLLADDHGRFRANAAHLLGAAFWAAPADVAAALGELEASGLVRVYKVRGQSYGLIKGWAKHQRIDRPGKARCPAPEEADTACTPCATDSRIAREPVANTSRADRATLATDLDHDLDLDRDHLFVASAPNPEPVGSVPPNDPTPESTDGGEGSNANPGTGDETAPPQAAAAPRPAPADHALQLVHPAPKEGRRKPKAKPEVECPSSNATGDEVQAFLREWQITGDEAEISHFMDHHRSKGSRFRDWGAAWRNWQRNGVKYGRSSLPRPGPAPARLPVDDDSTKLGLTREEADAAAKWRHERFMAEEVEPGVTRGQQIERREREYRETGTLKEAPL